MLAAGLALSRLRALEGSAPGSSIDVQYQTKASPAHTVPFDLPVSASSPVTPGNSGILRDYDDADEHAPPAATRQTKERAEDLMLKISNVEGLVESPNQSALDSLLPAIESDMAAVDRALPVLDGNLPIRDDMREAEVFAEADARSLFDDSAEVRAAALHGSPSLPRQSARVDDQSVMVSAPLDGRPVKRKATRSPNIASPIRPASGLVRTRHIPPELSSEASPFTPSPSRTHSPLREEIISSTVKRRRAHESPDKVYVSTSIPATRPTPEPIHMPMQRRRLRSPSPALSPAQRKDRILAGQKLVLGVKEQYRIRISGLSEKYDIKPTDLFKLVNEMPKKDGTGSQVYWLDVEEKLRQHFGY